MQTGESPPVDSWWSHLRTNIITVFIMVWTRWTAVLGGGNVAMDAARTAIRLGATLVTADERIRAYHGVKTVWT